jgi:hemerythrin-like domain-containing protein
MSDLSVQYLMGDHRTCEQVQSAELLQALTAQPAWLPQHSVKFETVCHFYRGVVLAHIRKEEEVLFPALEAWLPRDTGPLAVLRGEHRQISALFESLCRLSRDFAAGSANDSGCGEFARQGRALNQLINDHLYKEDRVLFPMMARFLSPERDAHLLTQMQAIGAEEATRCGMAGAGVA